MTEGILIGTAFLTATLSGVMGMGGGILLLAVMANFLAPAVLIPIHGVVQLGSNTTRSIVNFKHIHFRITAFFAAGAMCGAAIGSQVVVSLPENIYRTVLALFILVMTWLPKLKNAPKVPGKFFIVGGGASFLALFVGATGPLIAPFYLRENLSRHGIVASKAACQFFIHLFKILAFFALGFSFAPYWKLILGMLIATFLGTILGKFLLDKMPDKGFKWAFRILITILALRMLYLVWIAG